MIRLGLNFDQVKTNSVMTHVQVLSAKVRKNEWLLHNLDIGNMFGPTFGFQQSQVISLKELNYQKNLHCLILR